MTKTILCDGDDCDTHISVFDDYITIEGHTGKPFGVWHLCDECAEELRTELCGPSKGVIESVLEWIENYTEEQ